MSELITDFKQRKSQVLSGREVVGMIAYNPNEGNAKINMGYWFSQCDEDKSILSIICRMSVDSSKGYAVATSQTDFNVYPYADLNTSGYFNNEAIASMINVAKDNAIAYLRPYCVQNGYSLDIFKADVNIQREVIEPLAV